MAWLVLRAFSCAHIDDGSRVVLALRGSGARGVLPFSAELPAGARHPRREIRGGGGGRRSFASSRFSARWLSLCPAANPPRAVQPPAPPRPPAPNRHPPARPPRASMRPRLRRAGRAGGRGAAGGGVARRGADRAGARRIFMCGCGGAVVGRGIDWCWGNVIGVRA